MKIARALVLAVVSGLLLTAAMPPVGMGMLAWFMLAPLLAGVLGTKNLVGFFCGLATALTTATVLAKGWVPSATPMEGDPGFIYFGFLLFGLPLAAMGRLVGDSPSLGVRKAVFFAALGVLFEFGLTALLPEHLALTQARTPAALMLASYTGIWGVSFLIWLSNLSLAGAIRGGGRVRIVGIVLPLTCMVLSAIVRFPEAPASEGMSVAVLQTESVDLGELAAMNHRAAADLVIWPELSGLAAAPMGRTRSLKVLSAEAGQPAFVTTFEDETQPKPHNAAALFAGGRESARYLKRKPFAGEAWQHLAGDSAVAAKWRVAVGLNICFDSCYPAVMRDTARLPGIQFIALPTLDPPSKNGVVQALHASYTPFRAAMMARVSWRASSITRLSGWTALIDQAVWNDSP